MSAPPDFIRVIEASHDELLSLRLSGEIRDPILSHYAEILIAYLERDLPALRRLMDQIGAFHTEDSLWLLLSEIATLRLQIRERQVDSKLAERLAERATASDGVWAGELLFVSAMACETLEDNQRSRILYRLAAQRLEKLGARKKAIKATLNYVVAESRLYPEKKVINDYFHVYRQAKRLGQHGVAGVALLNISREYQKISAYSIALKFCNRSLALQQIEHGTLPYYLTISHRCHLLQQLGREKEAQLDYELALMSGFPEVQGALRVVVALREGRSAADELQHLTPTWKWRNARAQEESPEAAEPLGALEQKLIRLISERPRDKFELIEALYGFELSVIVTENRLKNLLNRLRRKRPGLIILEEGRYRIADEVFLRLKEAI